MISLCAMYTSFNDDRFFIFWGFYVICHADRSKGQDEELTPRVYVIVVYVNPHTLGIRLSMGKVMTLSLLPLQLD